MARESEVYELLQQLERIEKAIKEQCGPELCEMETSVDKLGIVKAKLDGIASPLKKVFGRVEAIEEHAQKTPDQVKEMIACKPVAKRAKMKQMDPKHWGPIPIDLSELFYKTEKTSALRKER